MRTGELRTEVVTTKRASDTERKTCISIVAAKSSDVEEEHGDLRSFICSRN